MAITKVKGSVWAAYENLRVFDVLSSDYRAKEGGTTDARAAIQSAIDDAFDNGGGFVMLPPNAQFLIDGNLNIYNGVTLGTLSPQYGSNGPWVNGQRQYGLCTLIATSNTNTSLLKVVDNGTTVAQSFGIFGIELDCEDQTAGSGLAIPTPAAGNLYGALTIERIFVFKPYDHGFHISLNANGIGIQSSQCREARNGSGFLIEGTDWRLHNCQSWKNAVAGYYIKGNTGRLTHCDAWNNTTAGLVDEGLTNDYDRLQTDTNKGNGARVIYGTTNAILGRGLRFTNCRFFRNNREDGSTVYGTPGTSADFYIGGNGGASIQDITFTNVVFGNADSGPYVSYGLEMSNPLASGQEGSLVAVNCNFSSDDVVTANVNSTAAQYIRYVNCKDGGSRFNGTPKAVDKAGVTGSISARDAPNGVVNLTGDGSTVINNITNGVAGDELTVIFGTAGMTIDFTGTNLKGNGGADYTTTTAAAMRCTCLNGTTWACDIQGV